MMQWAVVTTMAEPPQLVCAFVAHYLRLGAAKIHLFLDVPDPRTEALLENVSEVDLTVCDSDYWRDCGGRPHLVTSRQKLNAQSTYDQGRYEWLLHADADEFLVCPDVGAILAAASNDVTELRARVRERVWLRGQRRESIFSGVFRSPASNQDDIFRSVYGEEPSRFLKDGLKGYSHYKTFHRRGAGTQIGIHCGLNTKACGGRAEYFDGRPLLHFDGLTPRSWIQKMYQKYRIEDYNAKKNQARRAQIAWFEEHAAYPGEIFDRLNQIDFLSGSQERTLLEMGLLDYVHFDPAGDIEAVFPGIRVDLSCDAFDADIPMEAAIRALEIGGLT